LWTGLGALAAHLSTQSQQAPDTSLPEQVSLLHASLHEMTAIMLHLGRALDHVEQIAHEQQAERKAAHDA
jgi:hypothetical protein